MSHIYESFYDLSWIMSHSYPLFMIMMMKKSNFCRNKIRNWQDLKICCMSQNHNLNLHKVPKRLRMIHFVNCSSMLAQLKYHRLHTTSQSPADFKVILPLFVLQKDDGGFRWQRSTGTISRGPYSPLSNRNDLAVCSFASFCNWHFLKQLLAVSNWFPFPPFPL